MAITHKMYFQAVRDALVKLLGDNQGTEWNTIGFIERDQSAAENNTKRTAQVYYNSGDFPKSRSSMSGPAQHGMKFDIILTVAEKSKGDIEALEAATTAEEYAAALATFTRSEFEADRQMDDFISHVWLLIMAPQNRFLGLDITVYPRPSNRWIDNVRKEQPKQQGDFCTMRAALSVSIQIPEDIAGIDTTGLTEYTEPPYSGDVTIKGNVKQSGNLSEGDPIV